MVGSRGGPRGGVRMRHGGALAKRGSGVSRSAREKVPAGGDDEKNGGRRARRQRRGPRRRGGSLGTTRQRAGRSWRRDSIARLGDMRPFPAPIAPERMRPCSLQARGPSRHARPRGLRVAARAPLPSAAARARDVVWRWARRASGGASELSVGWVNRAGPRVGGESAPAAAATMAEPPRFACYLHAPLAVLARSGAGAEHRGGGLGRWAVRGVRPLGRGLAWRHPPDAHRLRCW